MIRVDNFMLLDRHTTGIDRGVMLVKQVGMYALPSDFVESSQYCWWQLCIHCVKVPVEARSC